MSHKHASGPMPGRKDAEISRMEDCGGNHVISGGACKSFDITTATEARFYQSPS